MTRTLDSLAMSALSPRAKARLAAQAAHQVEPAHDEFAPLAYRDEPAPAPVPTSGDRTLSSAAMAARSPRRRLA